MGKDSNSIGSREWNYYTEIVKFLGSVVGNDVFLKRGKNGWTPIHVAAFHGHTEIVKFLASVIENPNAPHPHGTTPLDLAAQENHTEIVEFLTQYENWRKQGRTSENNNNFFNKIQLQNPKMSKNEFNFPFTTPYELEVEIQ